MIMDSKLTTQIYFINLYVTLVVLVSEVSLRDFCPYIAECLADNYVRLKGTIHSDYALAINQALRALHI